MNIRFRRETKTERAITEAVNLQPPATVAQRIQAARIMGGIGYALVAGFLLTIGYAIFANLKTIRVDGTIVSSSLENSTSYGGTSTGIDSTQYWYELQYTDIDGVARSGKTFGEGTRTKYSTGDVLSIGYYPDDPSKVRIRNWFAGWRYQIVLFGFGLALIAYSIKAVALVKQEEAEVMDRKSF
ncbi:MAG: DUF3592 domain-containing protein [Paracoccaceae bacterium]